MDTVNGAMGNLPTRLSPLMKRESKRILIAIIVVILIVIAEFITNGQPVYEKPPEDSPEPTVAVLVVEPLDIPETEEKPAKELITPPKPKPVTYPKPSGTWVERCQRWGDMAGVPLNSWAIELIGRESKCDPTVWNYAGSGAGGIPQALPASKMGCQMNWSDEAAICQLKWMENYVNARYGSWQNAVYFHDKMNWY